MAITIKDTREVGHVYRPNVKGRRTCQPTSKHGLKPCQFHDDVVKLLKHERVGLTSKKGVH